MRSHPSHKLRSATSLLRFIVGCLDRAASVAAREAKAHSTGIRSTWVPVQDEVMEASTPSPPSSLPLATTPLSLGYGLGSSLSRWPKPAEDSTNLVSPSLI